MAGEPPAGGDEDSGEYVCDACGETFDSEAALRAHVRQAGLVE